MCQALDPFTGSIFNVDLQIIVKGETVLVSIFPKKAFRQTTENSSGHSHSHREGVGVLTGHYLVIIGQHATFHFYMLL